MPPNCRAHNCNNRGVHVFPRDAVRKNLWILALGLDKSEISEQSRLCRLHFKPDDYFDAVSRYTGIIMTKHLLKKDAVPSLFISEIPKRKRRLKLKPSESKTTGDIKTQSKIPKRRRRLKPSKSKITEDIQTQSEISKRKRLLKPSKSQTTEDIQTVIENTVNNNTKSETAIRVEMELIDENTIKVEQETSTNKNKSNWMYGSINNFKDDKEAISFYTGFDNYQKLHSIYSTLTPFIKNITYSTDKVISISSENQFLLTIMKLRQNKTDFELSRFYMISESTVSEVFITWINLAFQVWSKLKLYVRKRKKDSLVNFYMPESFKQYDKSVRLVINGNEFHQKPEDMDKQCCTKYKQSNTYEILKSDLDPSYKPLASKIFYICCMLCNFKECIIKRR